MRRNRKTQGLIFAIAFIVLLAGSPAVRADAAPRINAGCLERAQTALDGITQEREVMALVYLQDWYAVRKEPGEQSETVVRVPSGQTVQIVGMALDAGWNVWVKVHFSYLDQEYAGYIRRGNLACSDERFLRWEKEYSLYPGADLVTENGETEVSMADVEQFPASYQGKLAELKKQHPSWTFVVMNTGLEWDVVVDNEMQNGRSLVPSSFPDYMQNGTYSPGWAYAAEETLEYYLDPRNGLDEKKIFQFEQLTYNESYHTEQAIQNFLGSTFMAGVIPDDEEGLTYSRAFWMIGRDLGVSPFHLACRVYQEQGKGTSPLISGTYEGYEGYYNYFNIGASGTTNKQVIESGLAKAKKEGWDKREKSLRGGAEFVSSGYILKGQDTLYLQKFDVDDSYNGLYSHQYMQNICAPSSEAANIYKLYRETGAADNTFVFKIPVYQKMPVRACVYPTGEFTVLEGIDYAAVYSYEYYRTYNGDVANAYADDAKMLLQHFVDCGMAEGRQAKADFNVYAYRALNPDVAEAYGDDLKSCYLHYVLHGQQENRQISGTRPPVTIYKGVDYSAVFDPAYYLSRYEDVAAAFAGNGEGALEHFVNYGMSEGRQAKADFNVYSYYKLNPDLNSVYGGDLRNYYLHYVRHGKAEGRPVSGEAPAVTVYGGVDYEAVFDAAYYKSKYPDIAAAFGDDSRALLEHFVNFGMSEGRQARGDFNVYSYYAFNPDLNTVYGEDLRNYYMHYILHGKAEGRPVSGEMPAVTVYGGIDYAAVFDAAYYSLHHPDVAAAVGDSEKALLEHFVNYGMSEGRQAREEFDPVYYRDRYGDLREVFGDNFREYYLHYISYGRDEGRAGAQVGE